MVTGPRDDRDVFRLAPSMDEVVLQTVAERLEYRATDAGYVAVSQAYFDHLPLSPPCRVLALGCGTGVEVRALRRRAAAGVVFVGVDHSAALVQRARRETADEGLGDHVEYRVGDAHDLPYAEAEYDVVTMHTLLSHVEDPGRVLAEGRRVLRPGGTLAVFDGDYASLTFAHPDPVTAVSVEENIKQVMVANPRVMRDLPRLLQEADLDLVDGTGSGVRRHRDRGLLDERGGGVRSAAGPFGAAAGRGRGGLEGRAGGSQHAAGLLRSLGLLHLSGSQAGSVDVVRSGGGRRASTMTAVGPDRRAA